MAASPCAEKVGRLRDGTASVLGRNGPSCGSASKGALADWCCYGCCKLEPRNTQWVLHVYSSIFKPLLATGLTWRSLRIYPTPGKRVEHGKSLLQHGYLWIYDNSCEQMWPNLLCGSRASAICNEIVSYYNGCHHFSLKVTKSQSCHIISYSLFNAFK